MVLSDSDTVAIRQIIEIHERIAAATPGEISSADVPVAWLKRLLADRDDLLADVKRLRAENCVLHKTAPREGQTVIVLNTDNAAAVQRVLGALAAAGLMEVDDD